MFTNSPIAEVRFWRFYDILIILDLAYNKGMKIRHIALLIVGIVMVALGILWFLQGVDIVHLQPILCFANCEPITGKSPAWQVAGAITFFAGIVIIDAIAGRLNRKGKT